MAGEQLVLLHCVTCGYWSYARLPALGWAKTTEGYVCYGCSVLRPATYGEPDQDRPEPGVCAGGEVVSNEVIEMLVVDQARELYEYARKNKVNFHWFVGQGTTDEDHEREKQALIKWLVDQHI
jgi:hypothetical protein